MERRRTSARAFSAMALALALAGLGCGSGSTVAIRPTATSAPPTATATVVPPTATSVPPTATPAFINQGTTTLTSHCGAGVYATFDLESGSAGSSTPDVIFGDSCVSPGGAYQVRRGSASVTLASISSGAQTQAQFDAITAAQLHALAYASSELGVLDGWTFAVHTHSGHYAKVWMQHQMINFSSPDTETYTIQWVTYP
jgi:hypothetical protein